MTDQLADLTTRLLDAARRAGAEAADALAVEGSAVSIDLRAGRLETAERAEGTDIGLRVLVGGRQACVSASDLSQRTIDALAERARRPDRRSGRSVATGAVLGSGGI